MSHDIVDATSISIEVSKAEGLIQVRISGAPRQEAIVDMLDQLNTLAEQDPSLSVLIDETDLDPGFVGPGDIEQFVRAWLGMSALRSTRLAVFVANDAMFGLNRMFEGMTEAQGGMSVFSDRPSAERWLRGTPQDVARVGDRA